MRYIIGRKTPVIGSTYAKTMVLLTILAVGLLVFDYINLGSLMTFVLTGIK